MDLQQARTQLLEKRDELLNRIQQLQKHTHREEPLSADFAEQVVELENLDVLFELDAEGREELRLINRALLRLDNNEYDRCQQCGGEIGSARLAVIPFAECCVQCAQQAE